MHRGYFPSFFNLTTLTIFHSSRSALLVFYYKSEANYVLLVIDIVHYLTRKWRIHDKLDEKEKNVFPFFATREPVESHWLLRNFAAGHRWYKRTDIMQEKTEIFTQKKSSSWCHFLARASVHTYPKISIIQLIVIDNSRTIVTKTNFQGFFSN